MRLPRMTTRRWSIAILIVGLLMGGIVSGVRLQRRRSRLMSRARSHEGSAGWYRLLEGYQRRIAREFPGHIAAIERYQRDGSLVESHVEGMKVRLDRAHKDLDRLPGKIAYHAAMAAKYQHAVRYPWLPVEPDPPEPE